MKIFKNNNKECDCKPISGLILHQEIQSMSKENQKIKEEQFTKNLEKRVRERLKKDNLLKWNN